VGCRSRDRGRGRGMWRTVHVTCRLGAVVSLGPRRPVKQTVTSPDGYLAADNRGQNRYQGRRPSNEAAHFDLAHAGCAAANRLQITPGLELPGSTGLPQWGHLGATRNARSWTTYCRTRVMPGLSRMHSVRDVRKRLPRGPGGQGVAGSNPVSPTGLAAGQGLNPEDRIETLDMFWGPLGGPVAPPPRRAGATPTPPLTL